jgi:hypothetical protein
MTVDRRIVTVPLLLALGFSAFSLAGCGGELLRQYEYEEHILLSLDGSATVNVYASLPALVVLRGLEHDTSPTARLDRASLQSFFDAPGSRVTGISSWRRAGRRFVHVRLQVEDIRRLKDVRPFSWSEYELALNDDLHVFKQRVGMPASGKRAGETAAWSGEEMVRFRLNLPSKIVYHNVPSRAVERGNILTWEQTLEERRAGKVLEIEVRFATTSILYRTLWLFGASFMVAVMAIGLLLWWMVRRGRPARTGV